MRTYIWILFTVTLTFYVFEKTRFYKIVHVTIYTDSNEHNFIKSCFFDVFMHFELR